MMVLQHVLELLELEDFFEVVRPVVRLYGDVLVVIPDEDGKVTSGAIANVSNFIKG